MSGADARVQFMHDGEQDITMRVLVFHARFWIALVPDFHFEIHLPVSQTDQQMHMIATSRSSS